MPQAEGSDLATQPTIGPLPKFPQDPAPLGSTLAKINKRQLPAAGFTHFWSPMDTVELKRDLELLSDRLGKTQDYL
jgi:hypothetical protein